nr:MAG TPA: hypothetical protein [Caudoviricetes sp.]
MVAQARKAIKYQKSELTEMWVLFICQRRR